MRFFFPNEAKTIGLELVEDIYIDAKMHSIMDSDEPSQRACEPRTAVPWAGAGVL